jgi:cardiolipin synthase A/B
VGKLTQTLVALALLAAGCASPPEVRSLEVPYDVDDPAFRRSAGALLGRDMVDGNRITTLENGDGYFPPMLEAIRSAKTTITFETYIFWGGRIAQQFTDALCERALQGVEVSIIIDAIGEDAAEGLLERLAVAGARVRLYHPPAWEDLTEALRTVNRTHRRLLVIDGRVAFTGGAGIADEWAGDAEGPHAWRDTQFRLEGPIVAHLQAAFANHWLELTGATLHGDGYFPALEPVGPTPAQLVMGDGAEGSNEPRLGYLLALAAARREVLIENPYFVPDDEVIAAMLSARRRGVAVKLLMPGDENDVPIVRSGSRALWGPLLEAGIELWEYEPTMMHAKVMVVDRALVIFGSANLDARSLDHNDELNVNALDPAFAQQEALRFVRDQARSRRVTYADWDGRSFWKKLVDGAASLLRPQL